MRRKATVLLLLGLGYPLIAHGTTFSDFDVRTLKREAKHLETAALICALRLEGGSKALITEAWTMRFPEGPSKDDQLLVNSTILQLCPTVKER